MLICLDMPEHSPKDLYRDLQHIGERYAGVYLLNRFFVRMFTGKQKAEVMTPDESGVLELTKAALDALERENFVTVFHEYVHYAHEISTPPGVMAFFFELVRLTIFAAFTDVPDGSGVKPITGEPKKIWDKLGFSIDALRGGFTEPMPDKFIYRIDDVIYNTVNVISPFNDSDDQVRVPTVCYEYGDVTGSGKKGYAYFGSYFIYEGLAHYLDQLVGLLDKKPLMPESKVAPEYLLMEKVASHYFKDIPEKAMLEMASLSLTYCNPGTRFIAMVKEAANVANLDGYVMELYNEAHAHLAGQEANILSLLNRIRDLFKQRTELAAATDHLCNEIAKGFRQRMKAPTFEVDVVFRRSPADIEQYVPRCDMVYEFESDDNYMRDFCGTALKDKWLAAQLKTFLCHMDYYDYGPRQPEEHCCPLYYFCPERLRQEKPEQCRTQPWRSFEDRENYGLCTYGMGVAYTKGAEQTNAIP